MFGTRVDSQSPRVFFRTVIVATKTWRVNVDVECFCGHNWEIMVRPHKLASDRKQNVLKIRLTADERKLIDAAASGGTSTWARNILLDIARDASQKCAVAEERSSAS